MVGKQALAKRQECIHVRCLRRLAEAFRRRAPSSAMAMPLLARSPPSTTSTCTLPYGNTALTCCTSTLSCATPHLEHLLSAPCGYLES